MKKLVYLVVAACLMANLTSVSAQEYQFELKSKYRKIDKEGHEARGGLSWLGVGNIIFSTSDLAFDDEKNYKVEEVFDIDDLGMFQARAFFPASMEYIFETISERLPTYRFFRWDARGAITDEMGSRISEQNMVFSYDAGNANWESQRYMMHPPQNNWRADHMINPVAWRSKNFKDGVYYFVITTRLHFEKTDEIVGRWEGSTWIEEPAVYIITIARGQCEIHFKNE